MTAADQIIRDTVRESIGAIRLGRRIDRTVPTALIARALEAAAEEYAAAVPDVKHPGVVWTFTTGRLAS